MTQGPDGPTQQWSGEPQTPHGGDGKRSTFRRYLWSILAGLFALIAVPLAGVMIGSRNNTAGPPPVIASVQATVAPMTSVRGWCQCFRAGGRERSTGNCVDACSRPGAAVPVLANAVDGRHHRQLLNARS